MCASVMGVEVQKQIDQKIDETLLLWYRANVHQEEDVVEADVRDLGGPGNRGAHGLKCTPSESGILQKSHW